MVSTIRIRAYVLVIKNTNLHYFLSFRLYPRNQEKISKEEMPQRIIKVVNKMQI